MSRAKKPDRISWSTRNGPGFGSNLPDPRSGTALNGWIETPHGIVGVYEGSGFVDDQTLPRITRLYFAHEYRLHVWSYSRHLTRRGASIEAHKMARELAS